VKNGGSARARREVQIGYAIRVADAWELFGNGHGCGLRANQRGGHPSVSALITDLVEGLTAYTQSELI